MKAQHRHELETNALADRMGRLIKEVKKNPQTATRYAWILAGVAVAIVVVMYFASSGSGNSALWVNLDGQTDPAELEKIAREGQGSMASRAAIFQRARLLLPQGIDELYKGMDQAKAAEKIEEARRTYMQLTPLCASEPILEEETLVGTAKAEEALMAIPKDAKSKEMRGDLQKAIELYQRVAKKYPDTYEGKAAATHAKELESGGSKVVSFYADMANHTPGFKK